MTSTIFPAHGSRRCVEVSAWRSEIYAQEPSSTRRFLHPGLRNVREKLVLGWCREGDSNPHNPFGSADFKPAYPLCYLLRFPMFAIAYGFLSRQSAPEYTHAQPPNDHNSITIRCQERAGPSKDIDLLQGRRGGKASSQCDWRSLGISWCEKTMCQTYCGRHRLRYGLERPDEAA